ncbi:MAG TPA: Clp protease N-terminal domain-containing protein [Candidatus Dormibacteraeota bacterium]|nr:Clp protease N-terminal domain-containing protein [Candidatus Dormibacteraeota bacterium]
MFNLENAIVEWRRSMSGIDPRALSELESHLRDALEQRTRAGETLETALKSAVATLGSASQLRAEFAKNRRKGAGPDLVRLGCFSAAALVAMGAICGMWLARSPFERGMLLFIAGMAVLLFLKLPYLLTQELHFIPFPPAGDFGPGMEECFAASIAEAGKLGHDFIGTEHMLLGLLQAQDGPVARLLASHGISRDTVRNEVEVLVGKGAAQSEAIRCTPRLRQAFALAAEDAKGSGQNKVRPEDLLLGLLEGDGVAARVLAHLGLNRADLRSRL